MTKDAETTCVLKETLTPLLLPAAGVAQLLSVSVRMVWNMHQEGSLGPLPVHLGRKTLWRTEELTEWTRNDCPSRERWMAIRKPR